MPIPLSSPDITEAEISAVTAVLHRSQLSLGPELAAFEQELAARHKVGHAVALSSGTAGLHLALKALGIGAGDEVIAPSFTFVAVANAILEVGATPVFADVDPLTLNLSPATAEAAITPRTRALLVVHTFGIPAEMAEFTRLARQHNLLLIEDACEALGACYNNQPAGSFGQAAVFGFYPNKQITTGEGGAVITNSAPLAALLRSLRNQGREASADWLDHLRPGYNYRLSEMNCALGRVQLSRLDLILAQREGVARRYHELLGAIPGLELPPLALPQRTISWFVYVVRLPEGVNRESLQERLARRGIATGRYFAPIHLQPAWRNHPSARSCSLPHTEAIAPRTLALPFFNHLGAKEQQEVADELCKSI